MNKTVLYVVIGVVVVVLAVMLLSAGGGDQQTLPSSTATTSTSASVSPSASTSPLVSTQVSIVVTIPKTVTISYTDTGYNPANVTLKKGETVTFVNNSTKDMWPASAQHPTHNAYPETGGCVGSKFDACARIKSGQSWSFIFNQVGAWGYHDHLSPNFIGKITVTQ